MNKKMFYYLLITYLGILIISIPSNSYTAVVSHSGCRVQKLGTNDEPNNFQGEGNNRTYYVTVKCVDGFTGEYRITYTGTVLGESMFKIATIAYITGDLINFTTRQNGRDLLYIRTTNPNV